MQRLTSGTKQCCKPIDFTWFFDISTQGKKFRLENKRVLALAPKIAEFASKLRLLLTPSAGNFFTAAAKRGVKPKLVFLLSIQGFVIRGSS